MLKALVIAIGIVVGLVCFGGAAIYWLVPADHLPASMPGYDPDIHTIHFTHGLAMAGIGLLSFAMAVLRALGD